MSSLGLLQVRLRCMLVELPLVRCLAPQEASRVPLRIGFWVEGFGLGCRVRGSLSSRLVPVGFDSHNWIQLGPLRARRQSTIVQLSGSHSQAWPCQVPGTTSNRHVSFRVESLKGQSWLLEATATQGRVFDVLLRTCTNPFRHSEPQPP